MVSPWHELDRRKDSHIKFLDTPIWVKSLFQDHFLFFRCVNSPNKAQKYTQFKQYKKKNNCDSSRSSAWSCLWIILWHLQLVHDPRLGNMISDAPWFWHGFSVNGCSCSLLRGDWYQASSLVKSYSSASLLRKALSISTYSKAGTFVVMP